MAAKPLFVPPEDLHDADLTISDLARILSTAHAPYSLLAGHLLLFLQPLLALLGFSLPNSLPDHLNGWSFEPPQEDSQEQRDP